MNDFITAIVQFPTILFVVVGTAAVITMIVAGVRLRKSPAVAEPRTDLVGKTCVIRGDGNGGVNAEVTDAEGATRVIPIRPADDESPGAQSLRSGGSALIYDYDNTGGFFVVSPLTKKRENTE